MTLTAKFHIYFMASRFCKSFLISFRSIKPNKNKSAILTTVYKMITELGLIEKLLENSTTQTPT
jgi:hypothetical protein